MFKEKALPYISASEISEICNRLGKQIEKDYTGKELVVICILKGSIIFTADLIRCINLPMKIEFVRLSSYGNSTESSGHVRILKDVTSDIRDKDVLVVEDILDTGHTLSFFKNHLAASKPRSLKICTLLDKPARRLAEIEADYCGKAIEDRFVVGYGLDYSEKCRNYPDILYVKT
ncbi:MAG: hypoxanthine phosphoribosyltransferase [Oligoflexia bacterium]|nr:hypoxanthine phosphoribosyltransferase [Oligoflexia bacterium]